MRAKRAHENQPHWVGFPFCRYRLISDQSGGLVSPLRRGTESKGWTTYGFPPLATPFSLSVRYTFQPPLGWECTNSARRERAVRRSCLCWDYEVAVYFKEQLRAEYRFSAVRALSAAVRPAFSVPICAPGRGRGESDVQFVIKAKFDYRVDKRREKVQKNLKNLLTLRVRCGRLLTHL